jgi:hypothetical protein
MTPEDLIDKLTAEATKHRLIAQNHQEEADNNEHAANLLEARIHGIQEARALLGAKGNGSAAPRKPRRNIRAMVGAELGADPSLASEEIAKRIGCRVSQVNDARRYQTAEIGI